MILDKESGIKSWEIPVLCSASFIDRVGCAMRICRHEPCSCASGVRIFFLFELLCCDLVVQHYQAAVLKTSDMLTTYHAIKL